LLESATLIKGGILHLRLNNYNKRPIENKYREGKIKRTLNRELKELEVIGREAIIDFIKSDD